MGLNRAEAIEKALRALADGFSDGHISCRCPDYENVGDCNDPDTAAARAALAMPPDDWQSRAEMAEAEVDLELITEVRNDLPSLLAELREARKMLPIDAYSECVQCGKWHYTHADAKHPFKEQSK